MPSATSKIALVAALAAAATPASAFCPAGVLPMRTSRSAGVMALKAKEEAPKPTFGLATPVLQGNEEAEKIFGFLQSKSFIKEREGFLVGEMFADGAIRNSGFTEFAEKVNGRIAQIAFPWAIQQTFNGDILTQIAESPLSVIFWCTLIMGASLPPQFEANEDDRRAAGMMRVVVPPAINDKIMEAFTTTGMDKIFTEEAERTNGRAAMAAFAFFLTTAIIF